jgi:prepilin-type N-terminal cleavage/methylation domain-containing protein
MVEQARSKWRARQGMTLVELVIAVAIVGLLAAVAVPALIGYIKDARLNEAVTNIQGILAAEEAYFARFDRYTYDLGYCPPALPADGQNSRIWPDPWTSCNAPAGSGHGWVLLGWEPDGAVRFRYRVFSHNDGAGDIMRVPGAVLPEPNTWGVDWVAEGFVAGPRYQPWCAVEAEGDTDDDGEPVLFRGNSYNKKIFRHSTVGHDTW